MRLACCCQKVAADDVIGDACWPVCCRATDKLAGAHHAVGFEKGSGVSICQLASQPVCGCASPGTQLACSLPQ